MDSDLVRSSGQRCGLDKSCAIVQLFQDSEFGLRLEAIFVDQPEPVFLRVAADARVANFSVPIGVSLDSCQVSLGDFSALEQRLNFAGHCSSSAQHDGPRRVRVEAMCHAQSLG